VIGLVAPALDSASCDGSEIETGLGEATIPQRVKSPNDPAAPAYSVVSGSRARYASHPSAGQSWVASKAASTSATISRTAARTRSTFQTASVSGSNASGL
jgi:hypothetical protein